MPSYNLLPLAVALLTVLLVVPLGYAVSAGPLRICRPAFVEDILYWRGNETGVPLRRSVVARVWTALRQFKGPSFWVKVGDYGRFTWPSDWAIEARFYLLPGRQQVWLVSAPGKPNTIYYLLFPNDAVFALPDGRFRGPHPCEIHEGRTLDAQYVYAATEGR